MSIPVKNRGHYKMNKINLEKNKTVYSSHISNGIVQRRTNFMFDRIVRFLFRKVDFDAESLATLEEYSGKGMSVYASFLSSNTSLLVLNNLLKRNKFDHPFFAMDFTPYFVLLISNMFRKFVGFFTGLAGKEKPVKISESEFLEEILRQDRSIVLSVLAKEFFLRRFLKKKSDSIQYLVEAQKKIDTPIYIYPQIMFWNRNPERTKTLITSNATVDRSFISALFTVMKSATPPFMRISPPINLKEEIENSSSPDNQFIARNVRNKLLETYNHETRSILGPVLKTEQDMMEKVLYHKNIMDTIEGLVDNKKVTEKKLRKQAYNFYREIAADFSIIYIKYFAKTLGVMYNKIFDGIHYNIEDFSMLREAAKKGPLILMPSHKSHMDYLIISSVFYNNKLIPPHILSGSNLSFFPMGKIFRRSGAFFMRRSFKGMDLYSAILKQYIKTLVNEGYSIEFFIEGTRTRTGKLGAPKMGIMKYLIESIDEGYNKDLQLVPVNICYDRILEESSYQKELKGTQKKDESTSSFFKSRSLLKKTYGSVYLSFGEPVSFSDFRETVKDEEDLLEEVGTHMVKKISEIITVTPFSLVTAAVLFSTERGFSKELLRKEVGSLSEYLSYMGANLSEKTATEEAMDESVQYALDAFSQDGIITELSGKNNEDGKNEFEGIYTLADEDRLRINFYKNTIVHLLMPAAYLSIAILAAVKDNSATGKEIKASYEQLRNFFAGEFICPELYENSEDVYKRTLDYFVEKDFVKLTKDTLKLNEDAVDNMKFIARAMDEFFGSYLIVFNTILENKGKKITKSDLVQGIRKSGVKDYNLGGIRNIESLSVPNYNSAINRLVAMGHLKSEFISKKHIDLEIVDADEITRIRDNIKNYISKSRV